MNEKDIEKAFYLIGQLKGHMDGLHVQLNKPQEVHDSMNTAYQVIVNFMQAGSSAIRELREIDEQERHG